MHVRPARPDELSAAGEVVLRAYSADGFLHGDTEYGEVVADAAARTDDAAVVVAVDDGVVVGCVTFALPGSRWAELSRGDDETEFRMLGVDPSARGRGVGDALVRWCVEQTQALGRHRVVICSMDVMAGAHRLYDRWGFVRRPDLDWTPSDGVVLLGFSLDV